MTLNLELSWFSGNYHALFNALFMSLYRVPESRAFVVWVALIMNESCAPFLILMHRGKNIVKHRSNWKCARQ